MKDELKFTVRPDSRLIGGNQDATPDKVISYDVDLRPLRDGYPGRTGSEAFPGATRLGRAIGLAIRNHLEKNGSTQHTSRSFTRAAYEFMRFRNVNKISDCDAIDWDSLVGYRRYLDEQLKAERLSSEIPKFYSTIALLAAKLSPDMDVPANPFFTETVTLKLPSTVRADKTSNLDNCVEKSQRIVMAAYDEFERIEARFEAGVRMASRGSDPRSQLPPETAIRAPRAAILSAYTLENTLHLFQDQHGFEPVAASEWERLYGVRTDYLNHGSGARGESLSTGMALIQNWVLPSLTDLVAPFMLCNEFIGWNESVMLSLRSSTVSTAAADAENGDATIWSLKGRGSNVQRSPVISHPPFGPLDILVAVNRRTDPLRRKLQRELDHLREVKRNGLAADMEKLEKRIEWLEAHVDRLWLAFNRARTDRVVPLGYNHLCSRQFGALLINQGVFGEKYTNRSARAEFAKRAESSPDFQNVLVSFLLNHKKRETTDRHYLSHGHAIAEVAAANAGLTTLGRANLAAFRGRDA